MVRSYDELTGGLGRKIYFRAQRYPVKHLLEQVRPALYINAKPYPIHDLSMNGVSFYGPESTNELEVGRCVSISIELEGQLVYEGEGVVTRIQFTPKGQKVALRITKSFLDIPMMVSIHDELALQNELGDGAKKDLSLIPEDYKRICADVVFLMRRYRAILDRYEHHQASLGSADVLSSGFVQECEARFRIEWNDLRAQANELILHIGHDVEVIRATKRFTECLVTPEFMDSPLLRRSYEKPLGYPGDYEVMNYLYSRDRKGDSAFARMVHQIGLEHSYGLSVTHRMIMIRDMIAETIGKVAGDRQSVRIIGLACGPAREVQEYLEQHVHPGRVRFTLIDQDDQALSHAYSQVYPRLIRFEGQVSVDCLHLSFGQLLRDPELLGTSEPEHLIYAAGLFDYLSKDAACSLIARLFRRVCPGGLLAIGNLKAPTDAYWMPGYILDWPLVHRTRDEMLELTQRLESASVELRTDSTGYMYLLCIRRL